MDKNKNLLIFGAGQYGQVAKEIAQESGNFAKISFLDDRYPLKAECDGVIGKLGDYEKYSREYGFAFVAIGNADVRLNYIKNLQSAGFSVAVLVGLKAYVSPSATLEDGCIIEQNAVVNANAAIGCGTYVCAGAIVNHNATVGECCTLQCGSVTAANSSVAAKTVVGYNEVYSNKK